MRGLTVLQACPEEYRDSFNDQVDEVVEAGTLQLSEHVEGEISIAKLMRSVSAVTTAWRGAIAVHVEHGVEAAIISQAVGVPLRAVLCNLCGNALKFTQPARLPVHLRCSLISVVSGKLELHFAVEDRGRGMTAEELDKVLDPGLKYHTSADNQGGTGLGVNRVRSILADFGSDISFTSEPGVGTTASFTVQLPFLRWSTAVGEPPHPDPIL